ncbi:MAG: PDZ domain-containing protein [Terracidiphilus sp.]|jgi:membrane-associated protease RseP (regulator of RpoE activity)
MKHNLRPYRSYAFVVLLGVGAWVAMLPPGAAAQGADVTQILQEQGPLLLHSSSSQGYLGVDLADVDQDKAQQLKLKDVRGAVVTLIDHDAPAGQIGLKVNDVVLALNGQPVEGAEQLRRMLREVPAGRKVSLEISRDGNIQTLAVELADRRAMEHDVWNKIGNGGDVFAGTPGMGILAGGGDASVPGFHMPIFGSTLNVGALVEPLTSQMAEYLGVPSGLMVKQVARKSEAAVAGFKAFDVILKVGQEAIANMAAWDRALRENQGKPVQVTILRDRKQETLTLQVDSKHKQSWLELEDLFPGGDEPLVAEIDPEFAQQMGDAAAKSAEAARNQAQIVHDQLGNTIVISPKQMEQLRKQMEKLREGIAVKPFVMDQKQLDQLKRQMEEFRKTFKPEDFKIDPKEMDQLNKQMEQLKRQMEEMKALGFGNHV